MLVTFKEEITIQEVMFIHVKIKEESTGSELFKFTSVHSRLPLKGYSLASQKLQCLKHEDLRVKTPQIITMEQ